MDKSTLSNYGWVVIVTLVLSVMLAFATPFGSYIAKGASNIIKFYATNSKNEIDSINKKQDEWEDFLNEKTIIPIGATVDEYVIAEFNSDFTEVVIKKNGENSDGKMKGWNYSTKDESLYSPMRQHRDTLVKVIIEDGVINVGTAAFLDCSKIVSVDFGKDIKIIDYAAFFKCSRLAQAIIPDLTTTIAALAFRECDNLQSVIMSDNVTSIGSYSFFSCGKLETIKLSTNIKVLPKSSLHGCTSLEYLELPPNLTTIEESALQYCHNLKLSSIPQTVTFIGRCAFFSCENIVEMELPNYLTTINERAFGGTSLQSITIPDTVSQIDGNPFTDMLNFKEVIVSPNNPYFTTIDGILYDKNITRLITYPAMKTESSYIAPSTLKTLDTYSFSNTEYLASVILNEGLISIKGDAFAYALQAFNDNGKLYIPSTVQNIDPTAFATSSHIGYYTVSEDNAYYKSVEGVLFDKNVTTLIRLPIARAKSAYVIPETVTSMLEGAAGEQSQLLKLTVPAGLTELYFDRCKNIQTIYGKAGSYAETYANSRNITFIAI